MGGDEYANELVLLCQMVQITWLRRFRFPKWLKEVFVWIQTRMPGVLSAASMRDRLLCLLLYSVVNFVFVVFNKYECTVDQEL